MMPSIMLASVLYTLDSTIAAVAMPHMQGSFSVNVEQVAWVLTSYIVASAIATPLSGYLATRLGRRRLYLISIAGFTITSMMCGLAANLEEMVAFRVLQGAFGAPIIPLAQATILDNYPINKLGVGMGLFGLGAMLGPIVGPTLGAWLTDMLDWRWVFFINLPLGALALAGIRLSMPDRKDSGRGGRFDLTGFAYLSVAVGSFQLMLDRGNSMAWFDSTEIIVEAVVAGVCFYQFVVHILTRPAPFIDPGIFRDRNFVTALILGFVVGLNMMSAMALLPTMLQNLLGYPVLDSGMLMAPRGAGTMASMLIVGRLLEKLDARAVIFVGQLMLSYAMWQMSQFDTNVTPNLIVWAGFIQGFGIGTVFVPLNTVAFGTLGTHARTEAAAIYALARTIGGSVGISMLMGMLTTFQARTREHLVTHISPFNPNLDAFADGAGIDIQSGMPLLDAIVNREALMLGYVNDFHTMMLVSMLSMVLLFLVRPARPTALQT